MIDYFCEQVLECGSDAAVAMTAASLVREHYPDSGLNFLKMRGESWSSCNLYALMNDRAVEAAKAFEGGGQFGKKPARIAKAFGLMTLLFYKLRLLDLATMTARVSRNLGVALQAVEMPFAEGPIDVDDVRDFQLIETILKTRREAA